MKKKGQKTYKIKKLKEKLAERVQFRTEMEPGLTPGQLQNCHDTEMYIQGWIDCLKENEPAHPDNKIYIAGVEVAQRWVNEEE